MGTRAAVLTGVDRPLALPQVNTALDAMKAGEVARSVIVY